MVSFNQISRHTLTLHLYCITKHTFFFNRLDNPVRLATMTPKFNQSNLHVLHLLCAVIFHIDPCRIIIIAGNLAIPMKIVRFIEKWFLTRIYRLCKSKAFASWLMLSVKPLLKCQLYVLNSIKMILILSFRIWLRYNIKRT